MCQDCEFKTCIKDNKTICSLHEEEYKDDKQIIYCSAKIENVKK